jgi:hypothetical protein
LSGRKERFLGIDFSGNHAMWSPRCRRSNVWIADVEGRTLVDLRRVQDLDGVAGDEPTPFARLVARLRKADYRACGIDAPFALPAQYMPRGRNSHARLLARVASLPRGERAFASGDDFVRAIAGTTRLTPPKPLRITEMEWLRRRVNVRSPLWCGARPGAPMTVACLTLLHEAQRPIWPFDSIVEGTLCEAFPSAQVAQWNARGRIVEELARRVELGRFRRTVEASDDARDAVLATFGAMAIASGRLASEPRPRIARIEGWVAVHR